MKKGPQPMIQLSSSRISVARVWWLFTIGGVIVTFLIARLVAISIMTASNAAAFEARPEFENWTNPSWGTEAPATVVAVLSVGMLMALSGIIWWKFFPRQE
ncbi:hypothetical protein [Cryobacterium zongtaii]|uniref:hypothetical protein n=1 Tax=Cryobacterium zongtaii TaxID=1259217 RepID=UPI001057076D|nr:hypothetical protein [Cryobacterium zongtaii]